MDQAIRGGPERSRPTSWWPAGTPATHAAYDPLQAETELPDRYGPQARRRATARTWASYNVAPGAEPRRQPDDVLLRPRTCSRIDLFLADARTGKVKRQITRTAVDPHFESLQFIQSAGSWSADGQRFVFAGISGGRPVLDLYDVARGRIEREIQLPAAGRDPQPELVARRTRDRLLRAGRAA